ncbi:hypothetical protein PHYPO_G00239650 [Pangasianodon hypophthalmus]|uniref:Immunoglobulin V-set domain-containing protein n=1 Tax=Pangasianodon hypophthalmus TaxID=310915 RepID=A0A5N5NE90_PANHP|nr:hypothetical protein PHYPO_G00239650 [Pangasianodon hypophthalmus]
MTSTFPIGILWITICVGPLSAERQITGQVGSTAVLPCKLRVPSKTPYIRWSTDRDVFERSGKESFQAEGYESRVDVPEDQLLKGDCSLVLHNLTLADKGVYKSYQAVRRTKRSTRVDEKWDLINSVELSVDVKPVSSRETNGKRLSETSFPTSDARMNWPHPQVMVLSLLSCFLFQLFYEET